MADLQYSSDQYHKEFNPKVYLNSLCRLDQDHQMQKWLQQVYVHQHKFWSNYPNSSSNKEEIRYLEYGGGPVVFNLISAAPKVDRIVFAEYTEANRQAVLSWRDGDPKAHNWKPLINHIVSAECGNSATMEAVLQREKEVRNKIKSVVACDVYKTPIVDFEDIDKEKLFDVVTTSLCLEACVTSEEQYKSTVSKLGQLVKPNGYLCMKGVLGETFYIVGNEKYFSFPLSKEMVEDAMKEAKMEDIKMNIIEVDKTEVDSNCECMFDVTGRKPGNYI